MLNRSNLYDYQQQGVELIKQQKGITLFLKPGMGKTVTTLFALLDLKPSRTLIVAPPRVCECVWAQEAQQWKELQHLTFTYLVGKPEKRLELLQQETDFHLLSYNNLPWLRKIQWKISQHYDAIVFDESSKLKKPGNKWFRIIRGELKRVPIRVALTGSPTGNDIMGLWTQSYLASLDQSPIGRTYGDFKARYCHQGGYMGQEWIPNDGALEQILFDLKGHVFSFKLKKAYCPLQFSQIKLSIPAKAAKLYQQIKEEFYAEVGGGDILATSAGARQNKLRQIESGAVYFEPDETDGTEDGELKPYADIHKAKLEGASSLLEDLQGDPLLIAYEFKHELDRLKKLIPDLVYELSSDVVQQWNRGEIKVLALHPASAGHGLNLQKGGCNLLFFSIPWSFELWGQVIGRLYRTGQQRTVTVYHFDGFEVEGNVLKRLKEHEVVEDTTFEALEVAAA